MKKRTKIAASVIGAAAGVAASAVFCGFTTIRRMPRASRQRIRIACVGDSVTYGCTIPGCFCRSYPAVLQRMMRRDAQVVNFGVNNRAIQGSADRPYVNEKAYRDLIQYDPNVIVIELGVNDAKADNWVSQEMFVIEYRRFLEELVDDLRAWRDANGYEGREDPRILLCTPTATFEPWGVTTCIHDVNDHLVDVVEMAIRRIAKEDGYELIDLNELTEHHRYWFSPDGLHPNATGAKAIAVAVRNKL